MNDISIPVEYSQLDTLLSFIDKLLLSWKCSTILRLRCNMVLEELFDAAFIAVADEKELTCTPGAVPGSFRIVLHSGSTPVSFPRSDVSSLMAEQCANGLCLSWENEHTAILSLDRTAV